MVVKPAKTESISPRTQQGPWKLFSISDDSTSLLVAQASLFCNLYNAQALNLTPGGNYWFKSKSKFNITYIIKMSGFLLHLSEKFLLFESLLKVNLFLV